MEIPWTAKQTKLCFLFINCAIGRLFNSSTNPRTVTLRPLDGAMSEEAWRIILSLSPCFLDPLFAAPVPSPSPPDRRVADSSSVVFSCRNCAAEVGSESSVVCSAFFFFPLVGLEYGAVDEDDGREKGKKESKCFEEDDAACLF